MFKRRMIRLLKKLLIHMDEIHREYRVVLRYTQAYYKRLSIIRKVLIIQEKDILNVVRSVTVLSEVTVIMYIPSLQTWKPNPQSSKQRLVIYISMKVYMKDYIRMQQKLMNVRMRFAADDSIYTNNANRKFVLNLVYQLHQYTSKGRAAKDEPSRKFLRSELSKERAIWLEVNFDTQKQHYSLSKIKARNKKTKILWIFFGVHTTNAILIIDKIRN